MTETPFADAAPRYAAGGFKVLPLVPGKKNPIIDGGVRQASNDVKQVDEWVKELPPGCNVGLSAGADTGGHGLFIVDVDANHGGLETYQGLLREFGEHSPCPTVRTPNGGLHLFFQHAPGARCTQGTPNSGLGPGIDTRGPGGYVVAYPSVVASDSGETKPYQWASNGCLTLPPPPTWVLEKIKLKPIVKPDGAAPTADARDVPELDLWQKALRGVDNSHRDTWVRAGMALKAAYGDEAFDVWRDWSADGYADFCERECVRIWKSFRRGGQSLGTLFWLAKESGFDFGAYNRGQM